MSDPTQTVPTGFKREIGLFSSINILVGIIIGSGVFYLGSYILLNVQMSMGYALLAWTIGGVVSLLGGLCLAELGAMNPKAGGTYVYLSEAYHPVVGFTNEWTSILVSGAGSNAGLAIAFAMAISSLSPMSPVSVKLIAVIAIIVLSAVNFVGVKFGALVQNVFTVSKVIPIVLILFWGIFAGKETPNLSLAVPAGTNFGGVVMMIGLAVVISLWAYEGWANLNSVAEEIKNPQKNIPRAIIIALASITVIYVAFNFAIYRILPADAIKSFIDGGQMYLGTESARSIWGVAGVTLIAATMIISMFGSLNGCIMAFPREYYAVSKDGHFIPAYSWLHTKFGTPYVSIISQCVISIILALFNTLGQITALVVFASILYKMLTVFSVFIYRKKQPDAPRPYKVPLTYVTVTVAGLSMLALLVNVFMGDPRTAIIGLAVPLSGVIVYYIFFNKGSSLLPHLQQRFKKK
ncbi:MAG: amino acid permease [Treponema sp.]|jgi:APA family basic amino acid/polyamine antiporter|nr:amino acid permease [Treponema sp.]